MPPDRVLKRGIWSSTPDAENSLHRFLRLSLVSKTWIAQAVPSRYPTSAAVEYWQAKNKPESSRILCRRVSE